MEIVKQKHNLPEILTPEEKEEVRNNIKAALINLAISKIQLSFELYRVNYYKLWGEWGFQSMSEYLETLKLYSVTTYKRGMKLAKMAMEHGYHWKQLEGFAAQKLDLIFRLPPEYSEHIPDLLEVAKVESIEKVEEAIDIITEQSMIGKKKSIVFRIPVDLMPVWLQVKEQIQRDSNTARTLPESACFEYLMASYLSAK